MSGNKIPHPTSAPNAEADQWWSASFPGVSLSVVSQSQPASRDKADGKESEIDQGGNCQNCQQGRPILMKTFHLRSKPCEAYHNVSEHADGKNSARAVFEKMVRDQIASQPNDDAKSASFFRIPGPIAPPLDFGPDRSQEAAERREQQRDACEDQTDAGNGVQTGR